MANLLTTGITALNSFQRGLDNTANNIANANTPGYTRRVAEFGELRDGISPIGAGVQVSNIRRAYDQFLGAQLQNSLSGLSRLTSMDTMTGRIDGLLADPTTGLSTSMQDFFGALQDVTTNPSSLASRQVFLGQADALVTRFQSVDARFAAVGDEVNGRLRESVNEVNRLAESIAEINDDIVVATGRTGRPPNGLLDERDILLNELAGLVDMSTLDQDDGSVSVFIGNGQSLVLGSRSESLAAVPDDFDPTRLSVVYRAAGNDAVLPDGSLGGTIGGLLEFREQVLDPARSALGQTALGLALAFNEQHASGADLNGDLGQTFFSVPSPAIQVSSSNAGTGTASATIADVGATRSTDYVLTFDGANYSLNRRDNGQVVTMSGTGTALDPFVADGLEIVVGGTPAAGDQIAIVGTRGVAADIDVNISDPRELAAASPTRTRQGTNNIGSATISAPEVIDASDPNLLLPTTIQFVSTIAYRVNGAGPFPYTSGQPIDVNGSRFTITGETVAGDVFTLEPNAGGSGDNSNAVALAALQSDGVFDGGTVSISDRYADLVADVGNSASQIRSNLDAQTVLVENVEADIAAKSGVNLDEEAADLIRFQQAYEAAAQIIAVTNTLFDTLLGAVRR